MASEKQDHLRALVLLACEDLGRYGLEPTPEAVAAVASLVVNASRLGAEVDAAAEIARLTRELEEARRERSAARAEVLTAQASLRRVERLLEEARALLRELTGHEPVLDDERLRYVEIQVDREAWEAARRLLAASPKTSNN